MLKDESRHIAGTKLGVQTLMDHCGPIKTMDLKNVVEIIRPVGRQGSQKPKALWRSGWNGPRIYSPEVLCQNGGNGRIRPEVLE